MDLQVFPGSDRELLNLKGKNLAREEDSYEILVEHSKTDQLREESIVYISQTENKTCPVFWLDFYLSKTGLKNQPDSYLLCRLAKTKQGHNVIGSQSISYQTAIKSFNDHLKEITTETSKYSLHSLRSGGTTMAADQGVSDRFSKHGRWSGSTSRDVYIKDCKRKCLDIGKKLGINFSVSSQSPTALFALGFQHCEIPIFDETKCFFYFSGRCEKKRSFLCRRYRKRSFFSDSVLEIRVP